MVWLEDRLRLSEHKLVADLLKLARPEIERKHDGTIFKHSDSITSGMPDLSVTVNGATTWYEVKYVKSIMGGKIIGPEIQLMTAQKLERAGRCWYIVYRGARGADWIDSTCLVRPQDVQRDGTFLTDPHLATIGVDHLFVLDHMLRRSE